LILKQCNPPVVQTESKRILEPIELFIRKLVYQDLSRESAQNILLLLRKLNWDDELTLKTLKKVFVRIQLVRFSNIYLMAYFVAELSLYHPKFGIYIVDNVLEEIRWGLETNLFIYNQQRVAAVKYLAELYNYRMLSSQLVFETLYLLLRFGHENGTPLPGNACPIDLSDDFFRLRLCCVILDSSGMYFKSTRSTKKLDTFFLYMHVKLFLT
jgi:regulator of nonsense transcripts 2